MYKKIANKIKDARWEQNISILKLAEKTGIDIHRMYSIESGQHKFYVDDLINISKALNKDINYFLEGLL